MNQKTINSMPPSGSFMPGSLRMLRPVYRRNWWKFWVREYVITYRFQYVKNDRPS